jgi:septal ring factor EnvC (AmiA/AmiB activator)
MPNSSENEKWRKFLQPVISGLAAFLSAAVLYMHSVDNSGVEVRMNSIEQSLSYMQSWREKAESKMDVTSQNVNTLNVQLAQVLVKMDNIIESLKELKK